MKRTFIFFKRNLTECLRDPIVYIFCAAFPVLMLILFAVINACVPTPQATFEYTSLLPGILSFGFTFVMLLLGLLVSKDRSTAFLKRLYASPLKNEEFIFGYAILGIAVGIIQGVISLFAGYILSLITGGEYFSFARACQLLLSELPMLFICVFSGILFGVIMNDKTAPAITSVFISASGILGGAWMPLDTMGGFETICRFLPFYPSVYIGRIITGASHSVTDYANPVRELYVFDNIALLGIIPIVIFLVLSIFSACFSFSKKRQAAT